MTPLWVSDAEVGVAPLGAENPQWRWHPPCPAVWLGMQGGQFLHRNLAMANDLGGRGHEKPKLVHEVTVLVAHSVL